MKTCILTTLLAILIPITTYSQSIFLDQGTNGAAVGFGLGNVEEESLYAVSGSYSLKGKTDFSLNYLSYNLGYDNKFNSIILGVEHLLLKQKSGTPINVHLGANYRLGSIVGDELTDFGVDISASGFAFNGGISRSFGSSFRIVPFAMAQYQRLTLKSTYMDESESDSDSAIHFTVGSHLALKIGSHLAAMQPYFTFGDSEEVGLRFSFVLAGI